MALRFYTGDPTALLRAFKSAIDTKRVVTWSYDDDGDFTHTARQWEQTAWLRPRMRVDHLLLTILGPATVHLSTTVYAVFHGRFVESMLTHCDEYFSYAEATSVPTTDDSITN